MLGLLIISTGKCEHLKFRTIHGHQFLMALLAFTYYTAVQVCFGFDLSNKRVCAIWILISGAFILSMSETGQRLMRMMNFVLLNL